MGGRGGIQALLEARRRRADRALRVTRSDQPRSARRSKLFRPDVGAHRTRAQSAANERSAVSRWGAGHRVKICRYGRRGAGEAEATIDASSVRGCGSLDQFRKNWLGGGPRKHGIAPPGETGTPVDGKCTGTFTQALRAPLRPPGRRGALLSGITRVYQLLAGPSGIVGWRKCTNEPLERHADGDVDSISTRQPDSLRRDFMGWLRAFILF